MKTTSAPILMRSDALNVLKYQITSFIGSLDHVQEHHLVSIPFPALTTDGFFQKTTRIRLSQAFDAQPHPCLSVRSSLKQLWEAKLTQNPHIFDADKFRLSHWFVEGEDNNKKLVICMGMTSYRAYVSTCCSEYTSKLISDGLQLESPLPCNMTMQDTSAYAQSGRYLSRKIGVSGILETLDNHLVLIRRSESSNVYPNLLDTPGGHPEPQVHCIVTIIQVCNLHIFCLANWHRQPYIGEDQLGENRCVVRP